MNSVIHFEIPSTDLDRAKAFYSEVFGWQLFDFDPTNVMVATTAIDEKGMPVKPGAINGSIYQPGKPATPTIIIDVQDIAKHIQTVTNHGGKLVDDVTTIGGMGLYARVLDTEGNLIGLWQALAVNH